MNCSTSVYVEKENMISFLIGEDETYFLDRDGDLFTAPLRYESQRSQVTLKGALDHAGMGSQLMPCDGLTEVSLEEIRNVASWLIANRAFKTHNRIIRSIQRTPMQFTVLYYLDGMRESEPPMALFFRHWCESDAIQECLMLIPEANVVFVTHGWHEKSAVSRYRQFGNPYVYDNGSTALSA